MEDFVIDRFLASQPAGVQAHRMPNYSMVDFAVTKDGRLWNFLELKIRKETVDKVKSYGGLMLKHRKITDLHNLSELTHADIWVVFAFENGHGDVLATRPHTIMNLPLEDPPRRRNYRGLPTDDEPVCYLDWDLHLTRWRM